MSRGFANINDIKQCTVCKKLKHKKDFIDEEIIRCKDCSITRETQNIAQDRSKRNEAG